MDFHPQSQPAPGPSPGGLETRLPGPDAAPVEPAGMLTHLARDVDRAVAAVEPLDPDSREKALTVKAAIEAFHRGGLVTIVRRLKQDARGLEILFELVEDPSVRAILLLHGILRPPPWPTAAEPLELVQIRLPASKGGPGSGPDAGPRPGAAVEAEVR